METKDVILELRTKNGLSQDELTDFLVDHMSNENWPPEQARAYFEEQLPKLNYWKHEKTR